MVFLSPLASEATEVKVKQFVIVFENNQDMQKLTEAVSPVKKFSLFIINRLTYS